MSDLDPDLIEAREIVASYWDSSGVSALARMVHEGRSDNDPAVQQALRAIKRGRELERAK